jgi:hypothetical protein
MKDNFFYTTEEVREISTDGNLYQVDSKVLMEMLHKLAVDWLVMKSLLKRDD